jgi:signal transduction histidine kinase
VKTGPGLERVSVWFVALPPVVLAITLLWGAEDFDWFGRIVSLVSAAALYLRRRYPIQVAVALLIVCTAYYLLSDADGPIALPLVVSLYTVAAHSRLNVAIGLTAATLIIFACAQAGSGTPHLAPAAPYLLAGWFTAAVAVGAVVHNRRAYLQEADRRAHETEQRQAEELRRRATEERLRIARELHDVLGHNISLINVQSSAALHGFSQQPERAAEALKAIKETSRDTLRELRATLGVLRVVDEEVPTAPAAGLEKVGELVDRARSAGLAVTLEVQGTPRRLSTEAGLAGYRIVQESLTNVARHAAATQAVVEIRYDEDAVAVRIDDNGHGQAVRRTSTIGSGTGLQGMAERARALGGDFEAVTKPEGGFCVTARLPAPRSEQSK